MKRLVLVLILAIVPTALLAQVADRDVLVTQDGTLCTIESTLNDGSVPADAMFFLRLTIQRPNERSESLIVPESRTPGIHWHPALAYDSESKTIFVFWLKMPNAMSSELMLTSYSNGAFQRAFSIDNQPFRLRYNLRIGITRRVAQLQNDGSYTDVPALLVHATWWEATGDGETARYGLFAIDKGTVASIDLHDLSEFIPPAASSFDVDANFNREILRHPAFIDNGSADSIDVMFGDSRTNSFNRVTLRPIADGRIHIPIGAHPGGPPVGAPQSFSAGWSGPISTITTPHDGSFLLYNATKEAVSYILYSNGVWSDVKTLPLNEKLSADAAAAALSRMLNQ